MIMTDGSLLFSSNNKKETLTTSARMPHLSYKENPVCKMVIFVALESSSQMKAVFIFLWFPISLNQSLQILNVEYKNMFRP